LTVQRDAARRRPARASHRGAVGAHLRRKLGRRPSAEKALRLAPAKRDAEVRAACAAGKAGVRHAGARGSLRWFRERVSSLGGASWQYPFRPPKRAVPCTATARDLLFG